MTTKAGVVTGTKLHEHIRRLTLHVTRYYPDHEDRTETSLYRQTRHQLVVVEKRPCWVCDTREKLECHHFFIEWADQKAVDWDKFQANHPNIVPWHTLAHPSQFVDMPQNMMILCARHHRHINFGIHAVPFPSWWLQRNKLADFKYSEAA